MLHAVVMAGGSGTRFWPASRSALPKQLLDLSGSRTMIQATMDRLQGLVPLDRSLIVTNQGLLTQIGAQLPELPPMSLLGEPCRRDTAPCIGLAAALLLYRDPEATMLVLPADHVIEPPGQFQQAIRSAEQWIADDPRQLVTFGIRPTYPAETYGYIERGEPLVTEPAPPTAGRSNLPHPPAYRATRFREKPSADVAQRYLDSGNFYWNAGIFVWSARTILDALRQYEPAMCEHLDRIAAAYGDPTFPWVFADEFAAISSKSIDFAVMEHHPHVVVMEAPFRWDDVGSWGSLARLRGHDDQGNTVIGQHVGVRTQNCIIRSTGEHLIATMGLQDCIVVHTPDATLVAQRNDEESIRQIVEILRERGWNAYL